MNELILLAWSPGVDSYVLPKMVVLAAVLFWMSMKEERAHSDLFAPALAFLAVCGVSAALHPTQEALLGRPCSRYLGLVPLAMLVMSLRFRWRVRLEPVAWVLVVVASVEQLWGTHPMMGGRSIGLIGSPAMLGCVLAMLVPHVKGPLLAAVLGALALSGSRAGMLAAAAALAYSHRSRPAVWALATGALILSLGRISSDIGRINIWVRSLNVFFAHPWFGCGPEGLLDAARLVSQQGYGIAENRFIDNAHNDWLMVASTLGIAGLAAYAYLHGCLTVVLRRAQAPVVASAIALLVYSKLNPTPWVALFLLIMLLSRDEGLHTYAAPRRWEPAVAAMLVGCMTLAGYADYQMALGLRRMRQDAPGGLEAIGASIGAVPSSLGYQLAAQHLTKRWERTGNPAYLDKLSPIMEQAVGRFPASAQMRQIHATNLALLTRTYPMLKPSARISVKKALSLDPSLKLGGTPWMD